MRFGKAVEHAAVGHVAEAERAVGGVAADELQAVGIHLVGAGDVFGMHDDHDVEFLRLGPERIELVGAIVVAVDVGADVAAAKIKIAHGALQHLRRARRILQRHRCHADEAVGISFYQLGNAVVVNVAPVLALLAGEAIAQGRGVGFQRRHGEFGILHHFEPLRRSPAAPDEV